MTANPVARVWIYDAGVWRLADDQKEAGYQASVRLREGDGAQHLELWARPGTAPECQIIVTGELGEPHVVYAARLPEGFDLMAKWQPLVTNWVASQGGADC
jgi:hypothetical protein